jgi:hypothetical protein
MADRKVKYILEVDYEGESVVVKAQQDLREVDDSAKKASSGLKEAGDSASRAQAGFNTLKGAVVGLAVGFGVQGLATAAREAYEALKEGAALDRAKEKFDNLAESIGTTGDALETDLREATGGMIANAELIAGATDLMALGLAKSHDEAVRMSALVGKLGWDMQVLGLTIANQSTMRLDALGLSMEQVTSKAKALEEQGYSTAEAFKLAVIQSGEENLQLYGDTADSTAGKLAKLEATVANVFNEAKVEFANQMALHVDDIAEAAVAAGPALAEMAGAVASLIGYIDDIERLNAYVQLLSGNPVYYNIMKGEEAAAEAAGMLERANERTRYSFQGLYGAAEDTVGANDDVAQSAGEAAEATDDLAAATDDLQEKHRGYVREATSGTRDLGYAMSESRRELQEQRQADHEEQMQQIQEALDAEIEATRRLYEEARARGGDTFMEQVKLPEAEQLFSEEGVANADAVKNAIIGIADAAGAGAPQLGELMTQMGELTPEMAEAAVKAAIFKESLGFLTEEWKAGRLDTSEFLSSVDDLVTELETKSLVQIQAELVPPKVDDLNAIGGPWGDDYRSFWGDKAKIEITADNTPVQDALTEALGFIEGVPIDARTLVVEVNNKDVVTDIEASTVLVRDFVDADYQARIDLNIDSVETGTDRARTLLADLPSSRTIYLNFSSNLSSIIEEARRVGALP